MKKINSSIAAAAIATFAIGATAAYAPDQGTPFNLTAFTHQEDQGTPRDFYAEFKQDEGTPRDFYAEFKQDEGTPQNFVA